jgi:glyoxylase-like metal-dependent hydrolase (beta-lactamase superfamily II)
MRVNPELFFIELPMAFGGVVRTMNVGVIQGQDGGLTIVDTGLPRQLELIEAGLQSEGFALSDIKQIVLTHQDLDHVGSLDVLKARTQAPVFAYSVEVPYIDGTLRPIKMPTPIVNFAIIFFMTISR